MNIFTKAEALKANRLAQDSIVKGLHSTQDNILELRAQQLETLRIAERQIKESILNVA